MWERRSKNPTTVSSRQRHNRSWSDFAPSGHKHRAELASLDVAVTELERLDGVPVRFYFHDCDDNYFCVRTRLDRVD